MKGVVLFDEFLFGQPMHALNLLNHVRQGNLGLQIVSRVVRCRIQGDLPWGSTEYESRRILARQLTRIRNRPTRPTECRCEQLTFQKPT